MGEKMEPAKIIKLPNGPDKQVEQWQKEHGIKPTTEAKKDGPAKIIKLPDSLDEQVEKWQKENVLSEEEKAEVMKRIENGEWVKLAELEKMNLTGFFVSESGNMDGKLMIMALKKGIMNKDDAVGTYSGNACSDHGYFFTDRNDAISFVRFREKEDDNEDDD